MGTSLDLEAAPAEQLAQRTLGFASVGASYTLVGTVFGRMVVNLLIYSTFNQTVQISLDGVLDLIPIPSGGTLVIDHKANYAPLPGYYGVYVKQLSGGSLPSSGNLYVGPIGIKS